MQYGSLKKPESETRLGEKAQFMQMNSQRKIKSKKRKHAQNAFPVHSKSCEAGGNVKCISGKGRGSR